MEGLDALKKLVETLTPAEKRYVKAIGKAKAGGKHSQVLDLFDWLQQADADAVPPPDAPFLRNLPVLAHRLKRLVIHSLSMLEKDEDVNAQLRQALDTIAILHARKLHAPALRSLRRAKKTAQEYCRYSLLVHFLEWEQKITRAMAAPGFAKVLEALYQAQVEAMQRLTQFQELNQRVMVMQSRKLFVPRDSAALEEARRYCAPDWVAQLVMEGNFLEQASATYLLGVLDLIERQPRQAVHRFARLLSDWQAHPAWQRDQAPLLLAIAQNYQTACLYADMTWPEVRRYLALIPDFHALAPALASDYQRALYHNHFLSALNNGNFEALGTLIPEIERWMQQQGAALTEARVLTFLNNFAVAEFLQGHYKAANRHVRHILQHPQNNQREDIREFAIVLQAVIQFELGDEDLSESLTRAGKRHFGKQGHELAFELAIFRHLDQALRYESPEKIAAARAQLVADLDAIAEHLPATVPLLGLTELRIWATAKQQDRPIREVFLEIVAANLAALA